MKTKFILLLLLTLQTMLFASVGKITAVNGDVSVLRATKTIKAASGFVLEEKDGIKSQKGSSAQIVFNDKTVITVGSDTLFKVEEYSADAASPKARFGVGEGTFKAVTGKIGKIAPDKFKIETKTATIGIRGTTLAGRVLPSGETLVMCMRGAITVSPNIPTPPPPVVVNQGQITRTNMGFVQPAVQITPEDMRNIQGGLAPFARNTTQTNNGGDGGGQGQPQPQNQPPQNTAMPNLDTIKDLTTKAVDNLVNDGVSAVSAPKWADAYSNNYDKNSVYALDGRISVFGSTKANYDAQGGGFNYDTDTTSSFSILPTSSEAYLSNFFAGVSPSGLATISGEDSFSVRLGGNLEGYTVNSANSKMYTAPDGSDADYASWGYWIAEYDYSGTQYVKYGTWVGGAVTKTDEINALVANEITANYKGQSIGGVVNSYGYYSAIKVDANNIVNLSINFGSNKAIVGNIAFDTVGGQNWNVAVNASTSAMNMQFSAADSSFRAFVDGGNPFSGTGSNGSSIQTGTLDGNFYGPNAKTIGGSFKFVTDGSATASGVFKANKQ